MISSIYWHAYIAKNRLRERFREIEYFRHLSPAQRRCYLAERLLKQVREFATRPGAYPEWREAALMPPEQLWSQWTNLPIISKRELTDRFPAVEIQKLVGNGRINSSGGSTGEPTRFFQDNSMIDETVVASTYARLEMGWKPGMATVAVWGSDPDVGRTAPSFREKLRDRLSNQWTVAGFRINDGRVDEVLALLKRHKPVALYGYTSMLEYLADRILQRGIEVPKGWVAMAWNGAESLQERQAAKFREAFGCDLLNCYGCREFSVVAFQRAAGLALEIVRPSLFVELVDQSGRPVAPGQFGRVIVTCLSGFGSPFLRYDVGDLASYDRAHCDEDGLSLLSRLEGRTAEMMEFQNGVRLTSLFWNHFFKEFSGIHQFQIVIQRDGALTLRYKGPGLSPTEENRIQDRVKQLTHGAMIRVTKVTELPTTRLGKLLQVVRE